MAEVQILAPNGRVKSRFNTNIDANDAQGCVELLRKHGFKGAVLKIKGKKGWVTYR